MATQAKETKTCSASFEAAARDLESRGVDLEISHAGFGKLAMQVFTKIHGSL
jgi:hypothetical protein